MDRLAELGLDAPNEAKIDALQAMIESFNELDAEHGPWIETVERKDIYDIGGVPQSAQ